MFGYVTANVKDLSPEELKTYRGLYCGLCRTLKERHGGLSRVSLTYDMTFLIIFLSSLYEADNREFQSHCPLHPVKKIPMRRCIGCMQSKPKRELLRIVRDPEKGIAIDPTGKAPGKPDTE